MKAARNLNGFTLLELLVVLVLIGLLSGIATPSLQKLVAGIERRTQRDGLVADISSLSYRAYVLGQGFELKNDSLSKLLNDGSPILAVPENWGIRISRPIQFSFNGYCTGGVIVLTAPDATEEQLTLAPPSCRLKNYAS